MWNALLQPICLGCDRKPGPVCAGCAAALAGSEVRAEERHGLVCAWAAPHEPPTSRLVVALKESGARSLGPLLAAMLARPLAQVCRPNAATVPVTLLPIPQRPRNRLRRPQDPVVHLVYTVVEVLGAAGLPLEVSEALRWVRGGPDQSRLGADERRGNVTGALWAAAGAGPAVLVDDVVTTGATALEAARAARVAGWEVEAVVSITHSVQHR